MDDIIENTENNQTGLECKNCGCRHFYTDSTRKGKNFVIRYRRCRHCGKRLVTTERSCDTATEFAENTETKL